MDDLRFGSVIRAVRQSRGWRQGDLAARAGVAQSTVSRIERGHIGIHAIETVRAVARQLEIRVELVPRWRAGDLDRLVNARHSALHEYVARWFADDLPAWVLAPEVTFAIYADRGVIDILAWHPGRRALLVIELKTDIADVNELLGTLDKKRRVAAKVARDRGWDPVGVSVWLIVGASRTNRRRVHAHRTMLGAAMPADGRAMRGWLVDPVGTIAGILFWTDIRGGLVGSLTARSDGSVGRTRPRRERGRTVSSWVQTLVQLAGVPAACPRVQRWISVLAVIAGAPTSLGMDTQAGAWGSGAGRAAGWRPVRGPVPASARPRGYAGPGAAITRARTSLKRAVATPIDVSAAP